MPKFYVNIKMNAYYTAEVDAEDIETAKEKADKMFSEADFGEASDITGDALYVEDERGNRVWES